MAIVIPASCGGGGSDDTPQPTPTPSPTPTPEPEPELDITGLDNLKGMSLQVDQESDLLSGITFGNGAELTKTELVFEGEITVIDDPHHFTPDYPGTCTIILTVKSKDGTITEYKAENLTIKPLEYKTMEITNIKPVDILPILKDWE